MKDSQNNIGKHGLVAEYNANNAWLYNGNNGRLNNNNKNNTNSVRPVLEFNRESKAEADMVNYVVPLQTWYDIYRQCRKRKGTKPSHLVFLFDFTQAITSICHDVGNCEYVPRMATCFMIQQPRLREVIAADFADRLVQTYYANKITEVLERKVLHPDSYACRKGKGGLHAVQQLHEYIFDESEGYTSDVWLAKIDIKGFFMAIDTFLTSKMLCSLIDGEPFADGEKNTLLYLTRIIYQSMPQMHCIVKSPEAMFQQLPEHKKMRGKVTSVGVAIGNVTSQMVAMFLINGYLELLAAMGYKFVHYTDDTCVVVRDKARWLAHVPILEDYVARELHLTLHPQKRYLQHYSKGVGFLGYKLRFNRTLPSDRIAHNYRWKVDCAIRRAELNPYFMLLHGERFMQVVNSYNGLLKWCNAYRLRREVFERLKASPWRRAFYFHDDFHVTLQPHATPIGQFIRRNKQRKKGQSKWPR